MYNLRHIENLLRPPSPSYNYQKKFVRYWLGKLIADKKCVVDVGSGSRQLAKGVINLDLQKLPKVNIVGDANFLPLRKESIDAIISSALLEHVPKPQKIIYEIHQCLKPGGQVYFEVPFLQPEHAVEIGDYQRYTLSGIRNLLKTFKCNETGVCIGPFSVFAWYFRKMPLIFIKSRKTQKLIEMIFAWLSFWVKYFDAFVKKTPNLQIINGGVFYWGYKINEKENSLHHK